MKIMLRRNGENACFYISHRAFAFEHAGHLAARIARECVLKKKTRTSRDAIVPGSDGLLAGSRLLSLVEYMSSGGY
jgi:hypothetical protein